MEHGNVVIYRDEPGEDVLDVMRRWSEQYEPEQWAGVVVVRMGGLGERIVVTAWPKKLELERFDEGAAFAFVDAFRGRGPENPVRRSRQAGLPMPSS